LVEDHADTARIISRLLSTRGYHIQIANDMGSALRLAQQMQFDLLVSDLGLPDGDGLDLMRQLGKTCGPRRGIALSGYGMEHDLARSREAGFLEHLTKPVDLSKLEEAIERVAALPDLVQSTPHIAGPFTTRPSSAGPSSSPEHR
jgi:CheY-like chemotaxis protein